VNNPDCPGANVVLDPEHVPAGEARLWQVGPLVNDPAGAVPLSVTDTACSVTLPVFLATKEYVITCPTVLYGPLEVTDFVTVIAGAAVVVTVAVEGGEVTGEPVGGVPDVVAESLTDPLSRSACVIV
jgi:hypothetical protein